MPDRDFDPKDGGFIRIMNEFIDKLTTYPLDSNEWRIIMLVIRRTWGVRGRPCADIPWSIFLEKTKLASSSVAHAVKKLKTRNILHVIENNLRVTRYKINSKVSTWVTPTHWSETHSNPLESELQPIGVINSNPLECSLQPIGVTPIKEKNKDNLKDNLKDTPIVPMTKREIIEIHARTVIDYMNHLSGKNFEHSESSLKNVRARLSGGATLEQCMTVCQNKWLDPDHKEKYYRPITLFRPSLFESYINENGSEHKPTNDREERQRLKWFRRYQKYGEESTGQGQNEDKPH